MSVTGCLTNHTQPGMKLQDQGPGITLCNAHDVSIVLQCDAIVMRNKLTDVAAAAALQAMKEGHPEVVYKKAA